MKAVSGYHLHVCFVALVLNVCLAFWAFQQNTASWHDMCTSKGTDPVPFF